MKNGCLSARGSCGRDFLVGLERLLHQPVLYLPGLEFELHHLIVQRLHVGFGVLFEPLLFVILLQEPFEVHLLVNLAFSQPSGLILGTIF